MIPTPTIAGLVVTELRQISDSRGAVLHHMRSDSPEFIRFGECYFSETLPGAVKAWRRHRVQTQHFAVPVGRIRLVVVDDREGSPTCGQSDVLVLGRPDAYARVTVPPGLWYGFTCISAASALVANCADLPHAPDESDRRSWDDPAMPQSWSPS